MEIESERERETELLVNKKTNKKKTKKTRLRLSSSPAPASASASRALLSPPSFAVFASSSYSSSIVTIHFSKLQVPTYLVDAADDRRRRPRGQRARRDLPQDQRRRRHFGIFPYLDVAEHAGPRADHRAGADLKRKRKKRE